MDNILGTVLTVISIVIAFSSLVISFIFSLRKEKKALNDKENKYLESVIIIKEDIKTMNNSFNSMDQKIDKIEDNMSSINKTLAANDQRIKHLEKEVFKRDFN